MGSSTAVRATVVRVGNSRGIRIPKPILEQCGLEGDVELVIEKDGLKIRPCRQVRRDWDSAFALMAERGDDAPLLEGPTTSWDETEWEWK